MKLTFTGIATALLLAIFPFFTLGYLAYGDVNSKVFFVEVLTLGLALYGAYRLFRGELAFSIQGKWLLGATTIMIVVQYVAAFAGFFPERSLWSDIFWGTGAFFLTHLVLLAVLLGEMLSVKDWSVVRKCVALSAGLFGLLSILGAYGAGILGKFLWISLDKVGITFGNETYAGAYLLLAIFFALYEFFRTPQRSKWRIALGISILLSALSPLLFNIGLFFGKLALTEAVTNPLLLLGGARASSAALFALVAFLIGYFAITKAVKGQMQKIALFVWGGALVAGLTLGVALLFTPGSAVQNAYIQTASGARIIVWDATRQAIQAKPWLGWGPENFGYAFEEHFDSRVFEEKNLAEIWFERAHNVFLDTLATTGVIGLASFVLLVALYLFVVFRARRRELISDMDTALLVALVPAHLLQMQTGFDTVGSYTLLALALGYALSLENKVVEQKPLAPMVQKVIAVLLVLGALMALKVVVLDEYSREVALIHTFSSGTAEAQRTAIDASLGRVSSFESLRLSSASFIKGSLASIADAPSEAKTKLVLEFTDIYEKHYQAYLAIQPNHYRARMNYAYLLLIKTVLGDDRLADAKALIRSSYALSPGNPLTYILDSTAELYGGNVKEANRLMQQALAINPDIEFTQEAASWLETQKKDFPNISVLRITNL